MIPKLFSRVSAPLFGVAILTLSSLIAGCATNPVSGRQDIVLMSESQEIAMGKSSHQQIIKQYGIYENTELQAMVNRVGQKLAVESHRAQLNFTFTLLDSPDVNAFALPGGYIYITRGILAYLNSEEELAGVLGHEIGHVTARHGVKQQTAQTAGGLFGVLVGVATGDVNIAQTTNYIGSALVSGYGRQHELQADRLGAEYLAKINYDPESMLDVIGVLKNQELFAKEKARASGEKVTAGYHGVFSSHPDNDARLQGVIRAAKKFQTASPEHINPQAFMKSMNGLNFGDSQAQGIVHKNRFYHQSLDLHLVFPENWQLTNQTDRLTANSTDNKQIIQFLAGDEGASDPRLFLEKTFPSLRSGRARGAGIYTGITELTTPWGKRSSHVAAVKHLKNVFVFVGVGAEQFSDKLFFDTVESLGKLSRQEKTLAKGKKLKVVRAKQGDTFEKFAKISNLDQFQVSRLRLLNGLYPDGEPTPGQYVKIVE